MWKIFVVLVLIFTGAFLFSSCQGNVRQTTNQIASEKDHFSQAEMPHELKIRDYFHYYGRGECDFDRGALNDPQNNSILFECLKESGMQQIEALDISDLKERVERLQEGNLVVQTKDAYKLAFPAIYGLPRISLEKIIQECSLNLAPIAKGMIEEITPHLQGHKSMLYHVLWSGMMDGRVAWDAAASELKSQISCKELNFNCTGWMIYPNHLYQCGTDTYGTPFGSLVVSHSKNTPGLYVVHDIILEHKSEIIKAIGTGAPIVGKDITGKLRQYGFVDKNGKLQIDSVQLLGSRPVAQFFNRSESLVERLPAHSGSIQNHRIV